MNVECNTQAHVSYHGVCLPSFCDRSLRILSAPVALGDFPFERLFQLLVKGDDLQGSGQDSSRKQGLEAFGQLGVFVHSSVR